MQADKPSAQVVLFACVVLPVRSDCGKTIHGFSNGRVDGGP